MTKNEAGVKERIANDLAKHTVTVRHMDGMYRHWRCQAPGTWVMGFDIVTWPGSLCFTGDMGEYLFQRTEDMVSFMRGSCMSYEYAAEKCVAHDGRLKEWSEERFEEILKERQAESEEVSVLRNGRCVTESVADHVEEIRREYSNYSSRWDAEKAMYESCLWDGGDMPSCEEYTYHFLWALHAIKWFCEMVP
jgi:hypothetical protein